MTQTDTSVLSDFDGRQVMKSTIAITNAGDGLSDAMKVDPQEWHHGDTAYVLLECEVAKVRHDPFDTKDLMGPLVRVHVFKAGTATIVSGDVLELAKQQLAEQAERIKLAKEQEEGVQRLSFGDDEAALALAHANGDHDRTVEGCPVCAEQVKQAVADTGDALVAPDGDEDDEATVLRRNHMAGNHRDEPMPGCPICDQEAMDALMGNEGGDGDASAEG